MKTRKMLFVVVVASLALLAAGIGSQASDFAGVSPPAEAIPAPALRIPYAGTLAADGGGAVANGAYDFAFAASGQINTFLAFLSGYEDVTAFDQESFGTNIAFLENILACFNCF